MSQLGDFEDKGLVGFLLHDLANRVQGANGFLELLRMGELSEKQEEYAERIADNLSLISELMTAAHRLKEVQEAPISTRKIDVGKYLYSLGIEPEGSLIIKTDGTMQEALDELASLARHTGAKVRLSDEGIELIPPEPIDGVEMLRYFTRYKREDDPAGLGLSGASMVAERIGGELVLEEESIQFRMKKSNPES
ncbi:MAG: ATP-binding protein [Methermicoccaceae archaeon]